LKKKLAIPIVASVFLAFLILSVYVYLIFATAADINKIQNENGTKTYGCTKYENTQTIHCDPLMNRLVSYIMSSNSSSIYTTSGEPIFVGGKNRLGLEIDAKRMEAVEFANTFKLNPNKFSVSFWVKGMKNPQPYGAAISHANQGGTAGWSLDTYSNGTSSKQLVRFSIFNERGQQLFVSSPVHISDDTFAHIVGTFDGSSIKIYKNGILIGSTRFNGKYISDPILPLRIGSSAFCSCNWWSGIIDDLRFYNKAINENEVKEIFLNDSPGIVSDGLIGYWTFDGSLNDISGNNNYGNLNSMIAQMTFAPDGKLFFTEKNTGKIRIMKDDRVLSTPFATISDYYVNWEQGLLGITIDPKFEQNHFVYLYYTSIDNKTGQAEIFNRVVRFTENNNQGTNMVVLLDKIPATTGYHSGGALAFGTDDKLYIGVGDATEHEFAQDAGILIGKVLRINRDGTIPQDNPFTKSPVYTIGHRNIFGIAFDKKNRIGIIAEDGDYHYDKINLIQKGGNYGFPTLQPPNVAPELFTNNSSIKPLRSYWQTITPTQAIYYVGDKIPQLKNKFLFAAFNGHVYALTLDSHNKQIIEEENIALRHYPFEPATSIAQSPAGDIYYAGYHIYKLMSVGVNNKRQILFPIEIKPSNIGIKDLEVSSTDSGSAIDIHTQANRSGNNSPAPFLQISIPKGIMDEISSVRDTNIKNEGEQPSATPLNFVIDGNSSSSYNTISIHLRSGIYYSQLSINGMTTINNVHNIANNNNTMTSANQAATYNTPFVSIVKDASDSSTQKPYDPSLLNVTTGTTVKWTNNDSVPHTVTEGTATIYSSTNKFDSGIFGPGQTFEHTFDKPGNVKYYCSIHPFMSGEVIVK
jgi:glucose/arabinose dehydrogenase/plastocyanin